MWCIKRFTEVLEEVKKGKKLLTYKEVMDVLEIMEKSNTLKGSGDHCRRFFKTLFSLFKVVRGDVLLDVEVLSKLEDAWDAADISCPACVMAEGEARMPGANDFEGIEPN